MNPVETEALLARAFPSRAPVRANGRCGLWSLPLAGGGPGARIAIGNGYACLEVATARCDVRAPLDLVAAQSAWPGGAKYVASRPLATLRADVPLLVGTSTGRAWVVRQLRLAHASLLVAAGGDPPPLIDLVTDATVQDPELLAHACTAAGWNAAARPDGAVRVELPLRGAHRSLLVRAGQGGLRASVELAPGALGRASAACREAAGEFLLRASAALRWARAFARGTEREPDALGFECQVAAPHDEAALLLAIDTLIAACEMYSVEAEMLLEHAALAEQYMRRAGPLARPAGPDARYAGPEPGFTSAVAPCAPALFPAAHAAST